MNPVRVVKSLLFVKGLPGDLERSTLVAAARERKTIPRSLPKSRRGKGEEGIKKEGEREKSFHPLLVGGPVYPKLLLLPFLSLYGREAL